MTTKVLARGKHVLSLSGRTSQDLERENCSGHSIYSMFASQLNFTLLWAQNRKTMQNPTFSWPLASSRVKTPSWMEALKWQSHSWHCRSPAGHPPGGLMHSCPKCLFSNSISISLRTRKRQALGSLSPNLVTDVATTVCQRSFFKSDPRGPSKRFTTWERTCLENVAKKISCSAGGTGRYYDKRSSPGLLQVQRFGMKGRVLQEPVPATKSNWIKMKHRTQVLRARQTAWHRSTRHTVEVAKPEAFRVQASLNPYIAKMYKNVTNLYGVLRSGKRSVCLHSFPPWSRWQKQCFREELPHLGGTWQWQCLNIQQYQQCPTSWSSNCCRKS